MNFLVFSLLFNWIFTFIFQFKLSGWYCNILQNNARFRKEAEALRSAGKHWFPPACPSTPMLTILGYSDSTWYRPVRPGFVLQQQSLLPGLCSLHVICKPGKKKYIIKPSSVSCLNFSVCYCLDNNWHIAQASSPVEMDIHFFLLCTARLHYLMILMAYNSLTCLIWVCLLAA